MSHINFIIILLFISSQNKWKYDVRPISQSFKKILVNQINKKNSKDFEIELTSSFPLFC